MTAGSAPAEPAVPSPCVGICTLDDRELCIGCLRSVSEITAWAAMSDEQRLAVLERIETRVLGV